MEYVFVHRWSEGVGFYSINGISVASSISQDFSKPKRALAKVDFPEPDSPTKPVVDPG